MWLSSSNSAEGVEFGPKMRSASWYQFTESLIICVSTASLSVVRFPIRIKHPSSPICLIAVPSNALMRLGASHSQLRGQKPVIQIKARYGALSC